MFSFSANELGPGSMYGCRKMQGSREELSPNVSSSSPAVVSFKREPQISRSHQFQDVLGTNSSILLSAQNASFLSLSLAVLKWSTFPTPSVEHTCTSSHLSPREPGCGRAFVLCSLTALTAFGPWRLFPHSPSGWKSKHPCILMMIKCFFLILCK